MSDLNIDTIKLACARKKLYKTREEAEATRERVIAKTNLHLRVYYCKLNCKGWHLTKKPMIFKEVRIVW